MAAVASATLGFDVRNPGGLLGGKPEAHLFVGVQRRRRDECLFQASSTAIARIVLQVDLQPPQACGGVKLSK